MSRIPFDQLSKQLMEELLSPFGQVQLNREVLGESRFVDLWFEPSPSLSLDPSSLGLLGKLTAQPCLIEPFRNALSQGEIESCLLKLFSIRFELRREAKREKQSVSNLKLPLLWILTPTASVDFLEGLATKEEEDWPHGVYFSPTTFSTRMVVIHQLPETDETLWLRLLGKGRKQRQAIEEVTALSRTDPRRSQALKLLVNWKVTIEASGDLDEEGGELIMALSQAYLEWEKQTEQRGLQQGIQQGSQQARLADLLEILEIRFGTIPNELRDQLQNRDADQLRTLLREALTCPDLGSFQQQVNNE